MALQHVTLDAMQTLIAVIAGMGLAFALMPRSAGTIDCRVPPPPWDLPARMAVATSLVVLLTGLAPLLGARLTGLVSPFPVYGSVLAAFTHTQRGLAAARYLLRGFILGLSATVGFYFVLAETLARGPLALAYSLALATALALQAASLIVLHYLHGHG
jgi:hypothetical protein